MGTILEKTKKLIQELDLRPNSYYSEGNVEFPRLSERDKIAEKWKSYVVEGYYGFEVESFCWSWIKAIDLFLEEVRRLDEEFFIYQIKVKFGGARIYIGSCKIENLQDSIDLMEGVLFDEKFIY